MSASSLPKARITSELPNAFNISRPAKHELLNLTDVLYNLLTSNVPKDDVDTMSGAILGRRGSGKTVMARGIAKVIYNAFPAGSVNIIHTTSLKYAMTHMDAKPFQFLFIDDAAQEQSSRRTFKNTSALDGYNRLRHIHKQKVPWGRVIAIFAWQRWMDLDVAFRNSMDIIWLKTGQSDDIEKEHMRRMFGDDCYKYIVKNWSYTFSGDENAKSRSIVHIVPFEGSDRENGVFVQKLVDFPEMPEFIDVSKMEAEKKEQEEAAVQEEEQVTQKADPKKTDSKWSLKVKCYNKIIVQKMSARTAAKALKISHASAARYAKEVEAYLNESKSKEEGA